jgi:hypothetical protein
MVGSMEGSRFNGNKVESFKERERAIGISRLKLSAMELGFFKIKKGKKNIR